MTFADIIEHSNVADQLRNMVDTDRVPHAIMLHGPSGIGKMRLARAFAQYMACTHRHNGDSCGKCPACIQAAKLNYPDIHYVFPIIKKKSEEHASSDNSMSEWREFVTKNEYMPLPGWIEMLNGENKQPVIYVDQSNEIILKLSRSSFSGRYKTMIIWLPERMNNEAANKLLKILEEPWDDTVFILVSNDPDAVLGTIRSRCMRIEMHGLSEEAVASLLEKEMAIDPDRAKSMARLSGGSFLKAAAGADQSAEASEFLDLFRDTMRAAYSRNLAQMGTLSETMAAMTRSKAVRLMEYFANMLRENYIYNLQHPELNLMTADEEHFSRNFARFITDTNISALCKTVSDAATDVSRNANAKIVMFDFMLRIMEVIRQ